MISILVPVFNVDVTALVHSLNSQLVALQRGGEVIIIDDGSDPFFRSLNKEIKTFPCVQYIELQKNIGRLEIRKLLASKANYKWLLFLDGDSVILNSSFLQTYIQSFLKGYDVVVGGRVYPQQRPSDCAFVLHWKYGSKRENAVYHQTAFMTNNFCIKNALFKKLRFDVPWQGYGHEDTWVGLQIEEHGARVGYIENFVLHNGLERSEILLKKSNQALQSLCMLTHQYDGAVLGKHVRLFRMYTLAKKMHIDSFIVSVYHLFQKAIAKNLTSCSPALLLFDFYRLARFILIMRSQGRQIRYFN